MTENNNPSECRRGPLPEAARDELRRFQRVFAGVLDDPLEKWEADFLNDSSPWRELAVWSGWADVVERFTAHPTGDGTQVERRDVAEAVLDIGLNPPLPGVPREHAQYGSVSISRSREIHAAMMDLDRTFEERAARFRRLLQGE